MTKRRRNILLALFLAVAVFLAVGAWIQKAGHDPDNQGGVAFALLSLLVVLCIAIVRLTRAVGGLLVPHKPREPPLPARDATAGRWTRTRAGATSHAGADMTSVMTRFSP